jgi:RNA polymerase sigma-32 factor
MSRLASSVEVGGAAGGSEPVPVPGPPSGGELAAYFSQIRRYAPLTLALERELARAYRDTNDRSAYDLLVASNLRFVVRIARQYRSQGQRLSDLVQEGNLGLLRAVERYDPDRHFRLATYAAWWIRACIQAHLLRTCSMVKPGISHGRLRVAPGVADAVPRRVQGRDVSLDALTRDGHATQVESLASGEPAADEVLLDGEEEALQASRVGAALSRLDPRERAIVEARLMSDSPLTFKEVGRLVGCSPDRARQLETRARGKLRELLGSPSCREDAG